MVSVFLQLQQSEQEASGLGAKVTEIEQREEAAVKERDEVITTLQAKVGHVHVHYTCVCEYRYIHMAIAQVVEHWEPQCKVRGP